MILILLVSCFFLTLHFGRRSVSSALCIILATGYFYGIIRANFIGTVSYFLFDAAVLGLFLTRLPALFLEHSAGKLRTLKIWIAFLLLWPLLLFLIPVQDYLVQLVGLRGNTFLVPFLFLGALLEPKDLQKLAVWLGILNLIAFGFAVAEYFLGVPMFFPRNAVTEIIYRSADLVNYTAFRIPATFGNPHAYAGTMTITLPILIGSWVQKETSLRQKILLGLAITVSLLGVFMSGSRLHFVVVFLLVAITAFTIRGRLAHALGGFMLLIGIFSVVLSEERLQRFMSLRDTDYIIERVRGSVNMTFFELAYQYPLGNGLGGGGTSLPYFLHDRLKNPIVMENEYARIVLEQGIIGLYIWIIFICWLLFRASVIKEDPWFVGKRLALVASACYFGSGMIGIGLFTSIPQTCLLFLYSGWILSLRQTEQVTVPVSLQPALPRTES